MCVRILDVTASSLIISFGLGFKLTNQTLYALYIHKEHALAYIQHATNTKTALFAESVIKNVKSVAHATCD